MLNENIDRLSELLRDLNLSWLLPALRQDLLVWNSLNDAEFYDRFIGLHPVTTEITPVDFTPGRLALIALDHGNLVREDGNKVIASIDSQLLQTAIRSFYDKSLFKAKPQDLATAGLIALVLLHDYQATNSWNGLLDTIQDNLDAHWTSPLACLYGLVEENAGLLDALVQPGASRMQMEFAVHIVLSNPIYPTEQIAILMDLCHGPYTDLLPPRERLFLLRALSEQRPHAAMDFCTRWLDQQAEAYPRANLDHDLVENIDLLVENLFQIEVNKIAGKPSDERELLLNENEIIQHLSATLTQQHASHVSNFQADKSFTTEVLTVHAQLSQTTLQNGLKGKSSAYLAQSAMILVDQGYVQEANQLLDHLAACPPDEPQILYALARIAEIKGDHQIARELATRTVDLLELHSSPHAMPVWGDHISLVSLGKLLLELHKPAEAARIFTLAVQTCPNDVFLLQLLAKSDIAAHKNQEATDTLKVLVALNPDETDYHRALAQSLEVSGDWEAGLRERAFIIESRRDSSQTLSKEDIYAYANCSLNANHPDVTMKACTDLLADDQEDCQAFIYSGKACLQLGEQEKGMEFLMHATQVSPDSAQAWLALAEAQKKSYPLQTVIDTLNNACQAAPDSAQIHFALSELYLEDNTPTLALPELESAVSLSPDEPAILVRYGQALRLLGLTDASCEVLSKAYGLEPDYPELAPLYARLLVETGKLEEAITPLETLIDSKSAKDLSLYLDYARCILSLHEHGTADIPPMKALIALNEVLQREPDNAEAKALIAETLAANGDNEMAFQAYREALDTPLIEDKNWLERLTYGFGGVASAIGKYDVAIVAFQEAGQINPENPAIFKDLSNAFLSADLPDEAIRAARNVLVIAGENTENLVWFAQQVAKLVRMNKADPTNSATSLSKTVPSEALAALEKAIQLEPTRTDLLLQLGNFQAEIESLEEARKTFASMAQMDFATIPDLTSSSNYLSKIGDHEAAIACLENAISQDQKLDQTHEPSLYARLAQEYLNNNDHIAALNTLDKAINLLPGDGSLVLQKINLLLCQNQSAEALDCIEIVIQNSSLGEVKTDFLFLAARIDRAMGEFPAAVEHTQEARFSNNQSTGAVNALEIPTPYRTDMADIYRSLMQLDQAYKVIQGKTVVSETDFPERSNYLDYIFLQTELALETGEQIRPEFQDLQLETNDPYFPRLMAIKARLMNKAGNYKQAEQILQLALRSMSNLDQPGSLPVWSACYTKYQAMNSMVEAALDLGLWDQAINGAECLVDSNHANPSSYLNLAKAIVLRAEFYNLCQLLEVSKHKPSGESITRETYSQFSECLEKLRKVFDPLKSSLISADCELNDEQIYRWRARADIAFHQYEETRADPGEILAQQHAPGDVAALIYHLHQIDLANHDGDSITQIIKLARSCPRNPAVLLQVALAIQAENPEDAMKSLLSVLEYNAYSKSPMMALCSISLAKVALNLEQYAIAVEAIENGIDFWRDEPAWHALAAQIYTRKSDPAEAIDHLLEASRLAPKCLAYQQELGKVYFDNANDDTRMLRQALKSFENALGIDPGDVSTLVLMANTQYLLNDLGPAETNARKALMSAPERADIYQLLSEISIRSNDYQGAYEYANKAIELNPKEIRSGILLAHALTALGKHNEALAKLNALLPAGAEEKLIHLERVDVLKKIKGPKAGVNELTTLANSFPDDFNILNALAKSYLEVGELENAVNIAGQALKVRTEKTSHNEQANLHLLIGQVLRQSGHLDQSIYHLNEAIQLAPDRLEPYLELGLARKERREYQQALQIFEQATSIAPEDPRASFQAGLALKESKDYKSSEIMLRRAVSLAPNDLNIRRQLAAVVALNLVHNPRSGRN